MHPTISEASYRIFRKPHIALYAVVFLYFVVCIPVSAGQYGQAAHPYDYAGIDGTHLMHFSVEATTTLSFVQSFLWSTGTGSQLNKQMSITRLGFGVIGTRIARISSTPAWTTWDFSTSSISLYPSYIYRTSVDLSSDRDRMGSASSTPPAVDGISGWTILALTGTSSPYNIEPASFLTISPAYSSTTATLQVNLAAQFYNNGQYNSVGFRIGNYSADGFIVSGSTSTPVESGIFSVNFGTFSLATGTWIGSFTLEGEGADPASEDVYFTVIETVPDFLAPVPHYSASTTEEVQTLCYGQSGIIGVLCKIPDSIQAVITRAFVPQLSDFQPFFAMKSRIERKPPFGYITVALEQISGITASSSPAFVLASETNTLNNIFTPLRNGLEWLIYTCGALWLFARIRHVDL